MSRKKGAAAPMTMDQVREATLIAERIEALRAASARLDDLVAPDALVEAVLHDGDRSMALPKLPASTYAEFLTQGAARLVAQLHKMGVEPPAPASLPLQGGQPDAERC